MRYFSAATSWRPAADQTAIGSNEIFTLNDLGEGRVSLQAEDGRYVSLDGSTELVFREPENPFFNQDQDSANRIFTLEDQGAGCVALKGRYGLYISVSGGYLRCSASTIGSSERFGLIDQTQPAPAVPTDPPGTPLIAAGSLGGTDHLLFYSPTTGYVYRCQISDSGLGDAVLLNRSQPCETGCSSITIARYEGSWYLLTYRKEEGRIAAYPLDKAGLGKPVILRSFFVGGALQIGAASEYGNATLFFFFDGSVYKTRFTPGRSDPMAVDFFSGSGSLRAGWSWLMPVADREWTVMSCSRGTGEVELSGVAGPSSTPLGGVVERGFSQVVSFVATDGAGRLIYLRAGATGLSMYRITTAGLAQEASFALPALRPPTLRLHAVTSAQLASLGSDGLVKLCADTQIDGTSQLEVLPDPGGSFRLRSAYNTLLCVDSSGAVKTCPDSLRDATSLFQMVPQPGARFRLRTSSGRYVRTDALVLKTSTEAELQQQGLWDQGLFEWNEYGIGAGDTYVDNLLGRTATPPIYPSLVPVHSEYSAQSDRYYFSTRSANEAAAAGNEQVETILLAYSSPVAGTVPVYLEQQVGGQPGFHLSIRSAAAAAQWGYKQLGVAFHAYATQQPGTVPVYRESKSGTGGKQYYFSTRTASEAAAQGWQQEGIAFYANAPLIPVCSSRGQSASSYFFSMPGAPLPSGFRPYDAVFCAHRAPALGAVPVYIEQQISGDSGYHLSTRSAAVAAQWGYKQLGVAFYAYATQQPGTVPVYRERPAGGSSSQYYYSTRSAEEAAAAGAQQLDVAFYAYLPGAYVVVRTQLIDTSLGGSQQPRPAYRVVLDCRSITGSPVQSALTLSATAFATLQLDDGSTITVGPTRSITRSSSADGQLSFLIEPGEKLVVPVIKVKADFMAGTQVLAIAPDQNTHRALSKLDSGALRPLLGSRTELVKQVIGVLADSAPIPIAPTGPVSFGGPAAFGLLDDVFKAVSNFFTHTIPSAANDGARAISQAAQPVVRAVQEFVPVLVSGVNQAVAPGGRVMVALQGVGAQVQAVISRGAEAAASIGQQLQAGVNVVISFTTAIIHEAGSLAERAFNAFLIDAGAAGKLLIASAHEAQQLVLKLVEQAGKAINDLLFLVTSRFSWDNIVVTHNGINTLLGRSLRKMESVVDEKLSQGRDSAVAQIRGLGASFDSTFETWINALPTPLVKDAPRSIDSAVEYFLSLLQKGMGQAGVSFTLPPAPPVTSLTTGLLSLLPGITPAEDSYLRNLPTDPMELLNQGPRLFFQAARSLITAALSGVADLVASAFDTLKAALRSAIDVIKQLINAELSIPVLTPLYEQVIMRGNGTKLTLSSLLSLFAAMIVEGSYQVAAGAGQPFLSPAVASQFAPGGALAFNQSDVIELARKVAPIVGTALRTVVALVQAYLRAQYKDPRDPAKDLYDLGLHTLATLAQGAWLWMEWSMGGAGNPAVEWELVIWWGSVVFIWAGLETARTGSYFVTKGLFDIISCCLKMHLWRLKDQGASDGKRASNALEGISSLLQGISGGFKLGEIGEPTKIMMCRSVGSIADLLRAFFLFANTTSEATQLAVARAA